MRDPLGRALFERAVYLFVLVLSVAGTIWLLSDSPYDQTRTLAYLASGVLFGWWAIRGLRKEAASRDENEVFARAEQLEKTDPAAADPRFLLHEERGASGTGTCETLDNSLAGPRGRRAP